MAISLWALAAYALPMSELRTRRRLIMNEAPPLRPAISWLRSIRDAAGQWHAIGIGHLLKISLGFRYLIDIPAF